jgi:uncharacterized SAM-binding protein YcdF (DUF218 family)
MALDAVPTGGDTLQSIVAVARDFDHHGWRSAVIVTDPWHSLRSVTMAATTGSRPSPHRLAAALL